MLEVFSLSALTIDAFWSPNYKIVFNFALLCLRMKESNSNFGAALSELGRLGWLKI